jgi:hypothetical protein
MSRFKYVTPPVCVATGYPTVGYIYFYMDWHIYMAYDI